MKVGEKINTSMGKVLVLDIQERYLILFDDVNSKFIKAIGYHSNYEKVSWDNGIYANSFNELIEKISTE